MMMTSYVRMTMMKTATILKRWILTTMKSTRMISEVEDNNSFAFKGEDLWKMKMKRMRRKKMMKRAYRCDRYSIVRCFNNRD